MFLTVHRGLSLSSVLLKCLSSLSWNSPKDSFQTFSNVYPLPVSSIRSLTRSAYNPWGIIFPRKQPAGFSTRDVSRSSPTSGFASSRIDESLLHHVLIVYQRRFFLSQNRCAQRSYAALICERWHTLIARIERIFVYQRLARVGTFVVINKKRKRKGEKKYQKRLLHARLMTPRLDRVN